MLNKDAQILLTKGLDLLPFAVSDKQRALIEQYLQLLNQWNRVHNLTAVREQKAQVTLHVLDCLTLLPFISKRATSLADIGSGAGLPALMIALMREDLNVYAIESHTKKTAFIRQAALTMGLENVTVVNQRVEHWRVDPPLDAIVSRAMTSANALLALTKHLAHQHTRWHIMKAKDDETIEQVGFSQEDVSQVNVPFLQASRRILTIKPIEESL